jgi:hypothetical protein
LRVDEACIFEHASRFWPDRQFIALDLHHAS